MGQAKQGASSAASGSEIELRGVARRFGGVDALAGIDLRVHPGEFLTLLGPSGSGKSTLLAAIAGFEPPDAGEIRVDGRSLAKVPPHRRGFGMVFQHYALFPDMTVAQNVAFPLRMAGWDRAPAEHRVRETLALLRLEPLAARRPAQLSGGQQQQVAIARAIVRRPGVVLMDEPLSALDRRLRESIQAELRALHRTLGSTIVFVTHDQGEALALSDRIAVLEAGRIVQLGTPAEIYHRPRDGFVAGFVGESNLIEAEVESADGQGGLRLRSDDGLRFGASAPRDGAIAAGRRVTALLRPERIALVAPGAPDALAARVESTVFLGELLRIDARLPGGRRMQVRALDAGGTAPAPGDTVHLRWSARDAWVGAWPVAVPPVAEAA